MKLFLSHLQSQTSTDISKVEFRWCALMHFHRLEFIQIHRHWHSQMQISMHKRHKNKLFFFISDFFCSILCLWLFERQKSKLKWKFYGTNEFFMFKCRKVLLWGVANDKSMKNFPQLSYLKVIWGCNRDRLNFFHPHPVKNTKRWWESEFWRWKHQNEMEFYEILISKHFSRGMERRWNGNSRNKIKLLFKVFKKSLVVGFSIRFSL